MKIESLHIYPIKSCAGIDLESLSFDRSGPKWDRFWMIVDHYGKFLSQRTLPKLAQISVRQKSPESFAVEIQNQIFDLHPDMESGGAFEAEIWKDRLMVIESRRDSSQALSDFLQQPVRLVKMQNEFDRSCMLKEVKKDFTTRFTDAMPVLVVNQSSLQTLNQNLQKPIPINRFRANVVVSGPAAFSEDHWKRLHFANAKLDFVKECGRCKVIATDQTAGVFQGPEVLTSLKELHSIGNAIVFGSYFHGESNMSLKVGESFSID